MIVLYDESILTYVASIRKYFGLSSSYEANRKFSALLNERKPEKIFMILIDGMGSNLIKKKLPEDSFLRRNMAFETASVFPPTTTAATTSIQNGKAPNENGWLGWTQYLKEVDDIIIPFYGSSYYDDIDYGSDIFERCVPVARTDAELNMLGINATTVFPDFKPNGCKSFDEMCSRLIDYSHHETYEYVYAYWDRYDTYMHRHGPSSKVCDAYLRYIDAELERLAENISEKTMLVIVADHGQIDVKETYNLCGSKYDKYFSMRPSLEPRAQTFFIKEGMEDEFEKVFKEEFEDRFVLLSRQEVLETKLFGDHESGKRFEEFLGDYLAIAKSGTVFTYQKNLSFIMKGQHAGMCEDELMVPVVVYQK